MNRTGYTMNNHPKIDPHNLASLRPVEIADLISQTTKDDQLAIFRSLSPHTAVSVFEFLPWKIQKFLTISLEPEKTAEILSEMSQDDRTAFFEGLPNAAVNELLHLLPFQERVAALTLLGCPENSVGRLMTTDYIAVKLDWSVQQVLDYIRQYGRDSETINVIYVIDDKGKLIDDIRIREFLFAPLDYKVQDLIDRQFVALSVNDDDEEAIKVFSREDRVALPVTDKQGILIGIVTIDDILDLMAEEDTQDIQKIGGTEALEYPYMQTPFFSLMRKRASWLVILFLGELLTATTMGYFQEEISQAVVLALFLPLIISSGGNSGSQASTLIIRALVIGEVKLRDWWKIMRREILSGLFLGAMLGAVGFLRISLWSAFSTIYGPHWLLVATTVSISIIGVVLWGTLSGAMLPLILKRLGFDPAAASAPLVATLVDVTGIIIYFITGAFILQGTLL
ncbi:Magnesium transporter MgtE [Chlamydiales bacterium STE3]|nr:Magnesium transporter MgtE [Chlamydiales bacterium STE3]